MLGFLRRKKEKHGSFVYLSEPTFLYHTRTEKAIVEIIHEKLGSENILVPSDYGLRSTSHRIPEAEYFVAVAVLGKFTSLVSRELKIAEENGVEVYTLEIAREGDELVYVFAEGVPEGIEHLSDGETMAFMKSFLNEEFKDFLTHGLLVGSHKRSW
ncbi:hypothetical protein [Thermococcus sp. Bubb.Bath]|uniref:hypothetical protein n=1 Tax=Thermococcus sp. Bubb.Bath TaxID=1638242 RepID=UPI0014393B54|nr:hypothetical protein [Thermococcus sp. Bubb.Bath]NJF26137.1 hypothetical protein [Thermococcus sp. Bubb.Bath]